ncbi:MAG: NAD(P)H-quinone oxidoreductase [Alphaproteobacteria bacterium]|jgi:putative PIG3 family NAD(P)H quinone oxidoreductase|nr:NAD(P)H-quinone oxidoreductase [Rhodospirillaceae bacterium]MDP6407168.1 NAD(P)H-quinone oxidoreductase [Alphaproteobacteria bacterium]MDP6623906.1 NAD(P)H-quinone oxidoreductase [Alphaproteobacteria bacterium]|tara:strand:+ start:507 stop:1508 length:1002 start_codon:yes stop_codon:yes gene_type:complete
MSDPLPQNMTAIEISKPGGPEVLQVVSRPLPEPAAQEILIKVAAAGINRPDAMQRAGVYPPPPGASDLPGLEVAGTVVASGNEVTAWQVGDTVCALVSGGGYAEYCLAPETQALPVPASLSMVEAAALPETAFTVWTNVFERGRLQPGEVLLVHGGSSGIGTIAIQMATVLGARVLTTAGSDEKCRACEKLGAVQGINYRQQDFVEQVKEATDGNGVDVILDMVGGDYLGRNLAALAPEGRLVQIAVQKGAEVTLPLLTVMVKRLSITGSTLRPQSVAAKAAMAQGLRQSIWPLLESGRIKPVIDSSYPLAAAAEAHARLESGDHIGKIVLTN